MLQLKKTSANVFFNIMTPKLAARAIKKAIEIGCKPAQYQVNVAASIGAALYPAGLENAQGILTEIYIKNPTDTLWADTPDFVAWKAWMETYNPNASMADGDPTARATGSPGRRCSAYGDDLTQENVMRQAARRKALGVPMLLPESTLNPSATDFYQIKSVQIAKLSIDHWDLFGERISCSG